MVLSRSARLRREARPEGVLLRRPGRGLSLRHQLSLSLVTVLVPLMVVALVATLLMHSSARDHRGNQQRTEALAEIAEMQNRLIRSASALTGSIITLRTTPIDTFLAGSAEMTGDFALLEDSVPVQARSAVARSARSWQEITVQLRQLAAVVARQPGTEKVNILELAGTIGDTIIAGVQSLEQASSATADDLSAALRRTHERQTDQQRMLLALVGVGLLLVLGLSRAMSRRISRPLLRLQHAAERVEVGVNEPVELPHTPELAALASAHNAMTERLAANARLLLRNEARYRALITHASDLVLVVGPDTVISSATPSAQRLVGVPAEALVGRPLVDLVLEQDVPVLLAALAGATQGESVAFSLRHAEGRVVATETFVVDLTAEPAVEGFVLTVRDVTERKELEERLSHQAFHDSLTGLPNRALLRDRLSQALQRRDGQESVAVLFLDLNDFKTVNDSLGHGAGDELLQLVAARLVGELRAGDTASRLGGDEFVVLLESADEAEALSVAQRLQQVLAEAADLEGLEVFPQAAIGVAVGEGRSTRADELLARADAAMYVAKSQPARGACLYRPELTEGVLGRLELKTDLQRALDRGELAVHYQLTVDLGTGRTAGAEALLRWHHPERGAVSPGDFIPLAEETGLIVDIGRFVLHEACGQLVAWQDEFGEDAPPGVSVNVSGRQLNHPSFVGHVRQAIVATGVDPGRLVLEITETVLLGDEQSMLDRLYELKSLGVRIAIDDFGTGYSSLAYLQRLPVDILKVDKSFVDDLSGENAATSLAATILALAQNLRLEAIAEGIEQHSQAAALRELRCEYGQGFLFERPLPPDQLRERLAALVQDRGRSLTSR